VKRRLPAIEVAIEVDNERQLRPSIAIDVMLEDAVFCEAAARPGSVCVRPGSGNPPP
jgi:hypothetical protein